jgi:hypothetical protein
MGQVGQTTGLKRPEEAGQDRCKKNDGLSQKIWAQRLWVVHGK